MKKLSLFLDAEGVIKDETEHDKTRAELSVQVLSSINKDYTTDNFRKDIEEAVMLFIPDVYKYIFWKNTNNKNLYDKLYNEYTESYSQMNIPLRISEDLDHIIKYLSHIADIGILAQYDDLLIDALDASDILKYFRYLESLDNNNFSKPDPRYYETILNSAGVKASESIMLGVSIDKDIIPAKQIGMMKTIRFKRGIYKQQKPRYPFDFPDYEIDDLNMLSDIIEEIISDK